MERNSYFNKKFFVSLLSILISILILPFALGIENLGMNFSDYLSAAMIFSIFATPYMVFFGVSVNVLAGYLIKKLSRYKILTNFFIHTIPALIISLMLFADAPGFIGLTVLVASIFFVVDTLIIYEVNQPYKKVLVCFVPLIIYILLLIPGIIGHIENAKIQQAGTPSVELTVNKKTATLIPSSCWNSGGSEGCTGDTEPYFLPTDDVGIVEFQVDDKANVHINLKDNDQTYEIEVYYLKEEKTKKITAKKNSFALPKDIQEQVVKVNVRMKNTQMLSFSLGIRNGNNAHGE